MNRALLRIPALVPVALLLAAPGSANISRPLTSLTVSASGGHFLGNDTALVVDLDLRADRSAPRQITIHAPARFALHPERSPGSPIGSANLEVRDGQMFTNNYVGTVAVAGSEVAPPCNVSNPVATWIVRAKRGRDLLELPISLVSDNGLRLEICPPTDVNLASLTLALSDLFPPRTPGNYEWHAIVTPRSGPAYELRAAIPVPHVLTLRGHYNAGAHTAVLTGTLRAHGHPRARATIVITRLDRTAVPLAFHDAWTAVANTTNSGSFRVTVPLPHTQGFIATALPTVNTCPPTTLVRPTCRSTSVSGIDSDPVTITVP
jgi:hypothetical protein